MVSGGRGARSSFKIKLPPAEAGGVEKSKDDHDTLLKIRNIVRRRAGANGLDTLSFSGVRV